MSIVGLSVLVVGVALGFGVASEKGQGLSVRVSCAAAMALAWGALASGFVVLPGVVAGDAAAALLRAFLVPVLGLVALRLLARWSKAARGSANGRRG